MEPQAPATIIENTVRELAERLGFVPEVSVREEKNGTYLCQLTVAEDQHFLIGKLGVNLSAIQHLVRALVRRKTGERLNIIVDVNNYFAGKRESLEREAEAARESVMRTAAPLVLRPMQAYERKVVHSFLADHPQVMTESIGSGEGRQITVRLRRSEESLPTVPSVSGE